MGPAIVTVIALALAAPSQAAASDPLLSGYGGPGNGDQVVLGSKLLPPPGGGSGSHGLRAAAPATPVAAPAATPSASAGSTTSGAAGSSRGATSTGRHASRHARHGSAHTGTRTGAKLPAAAPKVVAYPSRASSAGGLPFSGRDLLVLVLALVALVACGAGLRRLAGTGSTPTEPSA